MLFIHFSFFTTTAKRHMEEDGPIKFTTSKAYHRQLSDGRSSAKLPPPSIQLPVITGSIAAFMLYFFVLREESDIDLIIAGEDPNKIDLAAMEKMVEVYEREGKETAGLRTLIEEGKRLQN